MIYVEVNNTRYEALVTTLEVDYDWDQRKSATINTSALTFAQAMNLFVDDVAWSIVVVNDQTQTEESFDYSEYNIAGAITDYRNGNIAIKMGQITDLEEAYELLYGGLE